MAKRILTMNKLKIQNTNNGYRVWGIPACLAEAGRGYRENTHPESPLRNSMEFQGPKSRKSFRFLGGTPNPEFQLGFSFIELMTVVAIIAILIIASMPAFRNYARSKNLKEGTNMIISALRKTRDAAITYRKRYRTVFDTVNDAVAIYVDGDDFNPVENWAKLPELVKFDKSDFTTVGCFPPSTLTPCDFYYLEFKPDGGSLPSGNGHITLKDMSDNGNTKRIYFYHLTGRIRVQ